MQGEEIIWWEGNIVEWGVSSIGGEDIVEEQVVEEIGDGVFGVVLAVDKEGVVVYVEYIGQGGNIEVVVVVLYILFFFDKGTEIEYSIFDVICKIDTR